MLSLSCSGAVQKEFLESLSNFTGEDSNALSEHALISPTTCYHNHLTPINKTRNVARIFFKVEPVLKSPLLILRTQSAEVETERTKNYFIIFKTVNKS